MQSEFPPGELIDGRFAIGEVLGTGATATVYHAVDNHTGLPCTLKFLEEKHLKDDTQLKRFLAEAKVLSKLNHPNILTAIHAGLSDGRPYIATELAVGGSVADRIAEHGPLAPQIAVRVATEVCRAIGAAHKKRVLHRDIKPQNILINADGSVVLADFGFAKWRNWSITRTNQAMGSVGYVPPEQLEDAKNVTSQADIYAIGSTLFALLRGGPVDFLYRTDPWDPVYADVAPEIVDVISRATRRNPQQRYANAVGMELDLRRAHEALPPDPEDAIPLFFTGEREPELVPADKSIWDSLRWFTQRLKFSG